MVKRIEPLIQHLRKVLRPPAESRATDGELLGQFITRRDETAFEALVRRHAKMIYAVCLRLLGNAYDAEDAFQATFLVLTHRAASLSNREAVGNWLYGVAYRTAQEARVRIGRQRSRERKVAEMAKPAAEEETWQQLVPLLDRELVRLPDKYRLPIVHCELEGRPRKEVARQLGVPEGTLSSRLATARKMLARRLAKYGPSSGAILATVLSQAAEASVSPALVSSTVKTVLGGSSAAVVALAQGVLKAMFISKLKTVSVAMMLAVTLTVGAVGLTSAQQKASVEVKAALPTKRTPATREELEVLRLEIEALRKDLQLTKERVQTLEGQSSVSFIGEKGQTLKGQSSVSFIGQGSLEMKPGASQVKTEAPKAGTPVELSSSNFIIQLESDNRLTEIDKALQELRKHPNGKKAIEALEGAVKRFKESPQGDVVLFLVAEPDPLAAAEKALKQLQQNPKDKKPLEALERAVNELKKAKAGTAPAKPQSAKPAEPR